MTITDRANATLARWRKDANAFVREELHATPDKWQAEALRLVVISPRLAMKACKGPGKTAVLAWIILWFLATHENCHIGAASCDQKNLETNLWPELALWMAASPFLSATFVWTKTRIEHRTHGATWFCAARGWAKKANPEEQAGGLAGLHAPYVMWVLDEVGGMPQGIMPTVEAIFSSAVEAHLVIAGNPTHTDGPLYQACTTQRHLYAVIEITGDPDDPMRSPRISLEWARQQIATYGRTNPWVMVNVLGQFPPASINALIGVEDVTAAMKRHYRREQFEWAQKRLGVDAARFGDDPWVLFPRQGIAAFNPVIMRNPRTTVVSARIARAHRDWDPELILIDDTGHWGHGVLDQCIAAGLPVIPVIYSDPATDKRYKNVRAEMYLGLADWIKAGGALPNRPGLLQELCAHTYCFIGGKFVLEEKDQVKAKIGRSPNESDALAQTFVLPEMPGAVLERARGGNTVAHDGDPFQADQAQALHDQDPYRGIH